MGFGAHAPEALALGQLGATFINNTTSNSGDWGAIQCLADCTFTTLTSGIFDDANGNSVVVPGSGIANLNGVVLKAGTVIYGRFSVIQLASGSVMAYNVT